MDFDFMKLKSAIVKSEKLSLKEKAELLRLLAKKSQG